MNKSDLKAIIKEIIRDELDEQTGTGAVGGGADPIRTPYAFEPSDGTKHEASDRMEIIAKRSMPPQRESNVVDEEDPANLKEAYSRYRRFKESTHYKKAPSKISYVVMEIKKMLKEVDYLVNISNRLKNETDVSADALWNRTVKDLMEIDHYVQEISRKAKDIGA